MSKRRIILENRLRKYRMKMGLSQVKLAILCGFACGHISDFERGTRSPWPRARRAIAQALGVSEAELFPESGGKDAG